MCALSPISWRLVALEEGLFTAAFLAFVVLRLLNPDLWQPWFGGEKMMEIAILNALAKSAYMPPYDPYFAGGYLNYYYYGQFIVNVLAKLSGIRPEVAFNLAVPTIAGLTVSHAFVVGYHLGRGRTAQGGDSGPRRRRVWAGLGSVFVVALMANLTGFAQLFEQVARIGGAAFSGERVTPADLAAVAPGLGRLIAGRATLPTFDYWYRGTRVIPYTINEFPFFSFLFADLHPHMIAIPFTILAIALCTGLLPQKGKGVGGSSLLRWLILVIAIGALGVINTWDLPAYLGILACVSLYRALRHRGARRLARAAASFFLLALGCLLAYAPFYAHYEAQQLGLALVAPNDRTQLQPFLVIWAIYVYLVVSLVALWAWQGRPGTRLCSLAQRLGWGTLLRRLWHLRRRAMLCAVSSILLTVAGPGAGLWWILQGQVVVGLLIGLLIPAGVLAVQGAQRGETFLQRLLVFVGLGILLGVEIVYIRDFLAGSEWRRMNTVFKFTIQAWVLLGMATGSAIPELWRRVGRLGGVGLLWKAGLGLLGAASLTYVFLAVPVRVNERFPSAWPARDTLDGAAYMRTAIYYWPEPDQPIELKYDLQAIEWLWQNVEGTPVIAEAPIGFYREGGLRVSSYTGLPTLLGAHQREQRPYAQVGPREYDAARLYETQSVETLMDILARHRVRYIYVGQLERALYGEDTLARFETLANSGTLERVYQNEQAAIYRVPDDGDL